MSNKTFLDKLSITLEELDAVLEENPSLREAVKLTKSGRK